MATSENTYPVLFDNRTTGDLPRLRKWQIPGVDRHLYLRDGSTGFVLVHNALWFDAKIERLDLGVWDDWGWAVRPIRGQTTGYSNHSSGTATDLNATRHPRGVSIKSTFTTSQIAAIHKRLEFYDGAIRWGGDYHSTPDGMHFEIYKPIEEVEKLALRLVNTPRGEAILKANPGALAIIKS